MDDNKNFEIKGSDIHGQGLFALHPFKEGDVVISWDGFKRLSPVQYEALSEYDKDRVSFLNDTIIVMEPPACFVNHSCDPNTKAAEIGDIACRDIAIGDEITSDYKYVTTSEFNMDCACGAPNCRGKVR